MSIKVLIIEDEAPARQLLRYYLLDYPQLEVLDECADGFLGAKKIMELKPDLVFLDVQMPKINGFEMLELLHDQEIPLIIFTTAFDHFALKAFEYNTCDYLLKPISKERFDKAVGRAIAMHAEHKGQEGQVRALAEVALVQSGFLDRIIVRSGSHIHVVHMENLFCLEASDDYVILHTDGEQWTKKQTLRFYEEKLDPREFLRVHRSFIIKVSAITRLEPYSKDAYLAILKNGYKVSVSKAGYTRLKELMSF